MIPVVVRDVKIGGGMPVICLPVTGKNNREILSQIDGILNVVKGITEYIVEWRADWYENMTDCNAVRCAAQLIRDKIGNVPLLFTVRSDKEGGESHLTYNQYAKVNIGAIQTGLIDLVDVELYTDKEYIADIFSAAKTNRVKIIMSNHDFNATPAACDIISRLNSMRDYGCDICKIAVMPQSNADVLELLSATDKFSSSADLPLITMSMGGKGLISRLCGEVFGSAITFGCADTASAPGQIDAQKLWQTLCIIHDSVKK